MQQKWNQKFIFSPPTIEIIFEVAQMLDEPIVWNGEWSNSCNFLFEFCQNARVWNTAQI